MEESRGHQISLRLVWENGDTQVVKSRPEGMHCWMFTLSSPKVRSMPAVSYRGSAITAGCYWKWDGKQNVVSLKRND
jgi:hypothetical protein